MIRFRDGELVTRYSSIPFNPILFLNFILCYLQLQVVQYNVTLLMPFNRYALLRSEKEKTALPEKVIGKLEKK
jgi:hypothetical protein